MVWLNIHRDDICIEIAGAVPGNIVMVSGIFQSVFFMLLSPSITGTVKPKIRYQSHVPVPTLAEDITVFVAYGSLNLGRL